MDEADRLPLVGRDRELGTLLQALTELPTRGAAVMIRGEPGLGKSRLAQELLSIARRRGYQTALGATSELEQQRPFAALIDALAGQDRSHTATHLLDLLVGRAEAGEALVQGAMDLRFLALEEALAYLEGRLGTAPLVMVLEDLHWADSTTLLLFTRATSRLLGGPFLLVGTRRPWPRVAELDRIEEYEKVTSIELSPLNEAQSMLLAERALGDSPSDDLAQRLRGAGGNPLFVREIIFATRASAGPVTNFAASVIGRLNYVSPGCLEFLRMAALLGTRFRFSDLCVTMGRSALELAPILDEAVRSGLLGEDAERLRFNHDLAREAIYEDMPAGLRRSLHLQLAHDLAIAGAASLDVAPHFAIGADPGDELATRWIWRAGRDAAARSPASAVELFGRALELAPEDLDGRDLLIADQVQGLLWSGQFYRAEARAKELLNRPHDSQAGAAVRYALARVLVYEGRVRESLEQVSAALGDDDLHPRYRSSLLSDFALRGLVLGDIHGAIAAAEESLAIADRLADSSLVALALSAASRIADHRGYVEESIEMARRAAFGVAAQARDAIQFVQPALYLGLALTSADRFSDALDILSRGRRDAESVGATWSLPLFHLASARALFYLERWDDAIAEAESSIILSSETGTKVWLPWARSIIARIHLHRDDLKRARAEIAAARAQEDEAACPQFGGSWIAWSEALLDEAEGDISGAAKILASEWDRWPTEEPVGDHRESAPDMVRLALAVGDRPGAERAAAAAAEAAARWRSPSAEGVALACTGWLQSDARLLEEAADRLLASGRRLAAAHCLEAAVDFRHEQAPTLLRGALGIYESLLASRDASRVESALRRLGIRRGRTGLRQRPTHGWDSLTDTEVRIVTLVSEGLTNPRIAERLFISRRTVETHVSHALAKIGVSSRAELAAEAVRHEPSKAI